MYVNNNNTYNTSMEDLGATTGEFQIPKPFMSNIERYYLFRFVHYNSFGIVSDVICIILDSSAISAPKF